jgi:ATP-dependent Clp protease protease subunit
MSKYQTNVSYKDIPTILLEERIINVVGEVNDAMAYEVTSLLHILNNESKTKPIQLLINSPGGSCSSGLAIIDTMNFIDAPIIGVVDGLAASMGAAILESCTKRCALPNAQIMFHQASSGCQGNVQDMRVSLKQTERVNERLADIICKRAGITRKEYYKLTQRDLWLWPEEALEKNLIDEIIPMKEKKLD